MASSTPHTILLHSEGQGRQRKNDAQANGTVTPGDLVERDSLNTSGAETVFEITTHSTEDVKTAPLVALEYAKTGRGISDDYSDGDHMEYWVAQPGDRLYMQVSAPANLTTSGNANVTVGDTLVSGGDGGLQANGTRGAELFEALESVDNSTPGTSTLSRIKVEAI